MSKETQNTGFKRNQRKGTASSIEVSIAVSTIVDHLLAMYSDTLHLGDAPSVTLVQKEIEAMANRYDIDDTYTWRYHQNIIIAASIEANKLFNAILGDVHLTAEKAKREKNDDYKIKKYKATNYEVSLRVNLNDVEKDQAEKEQDMMRQAKMDFIANLPAEKITDDEAVNLIKAHFGKFFVQGKEDLNSEQILGWIKQTLSSIDGKFVKQPVMLSFYSQAQNTGKTTIYDSIRKAFGDLSQTYTIQSIDRDPAYMTFPVLLMEELSYEKRSDLDVLKQVITYGSPSLKKLYSQNSIRGKSIANFIAFTNSDPTYMWNGTERRNAVVYMQDGKKLSDEEIRSKGWESFEEYSDYFWSNLISRVDYSNANEYLRSLEKNLIATQKEENSRNTMMDVFRSYPSLLKNIDQFIIIRGSNKILNKLTFSKRLEELGIQMSERLLNNQLQALEIINPNWQVRVKNIKKLQDQLDSESIVEEIEDLTLELPYPVVTLQKPVKEVKEVKEVKKEVISITKKAPPKAPKAQESNLEQENKDLKNQLAQMQEQMQQMQEMMIKLMGNK